MLARRKATTILLAMSLAVSLTGCRSSDTPRQPLTEPTEAAIQRQAVAAPTPNLVPLPTQTPTAEANPVPTPTLQVRTIEAGDLLITTIDVERHSIDLPSFQTASANELGADPRISILSTTVDGDLRADGRPVSVISFTASDADRTFEGRQYAVARPDGDGFLVVTCIAANRDINLCDDEIRNFELDDIGAVDQVSD